ncbi:MAG TPA: hypothetical protein VN881_02525 [Candidatus Acidoferrales bacterium]|nr:hypothetical protein [Candidatus Acidoferrales bacterium]
MVRHSKGYHGWMLDPFERSEDDIRFTPLWYIASALILAGAITLFFTSHNSVAGFLNMSGCGIGLFASYRNKRDTTNPLTLGLTSSRKKSSSI